jgi:hypothetical protein
MIRPLTPEDRQEILHGQMIPAIKAFRSYMDLGLIGCKRAVESIREGRISVDEALGQSGLKTPCPHCKGTGFVDESTERGTP